MSVLREKKSHLWDRDPHDWYVEPPECSAALFICEDFVGTVWDPACGLGRIISSAQTAGYKAFGSDIVQRSDHCIKEVDFLRQDTACEGDNIVSNPPFGIAEDFVRKAIDLVPRGGKVAMLLPLVWLSGFSTKRDWLPTSPLYKFYPISPRPSMPPGRVIEEGIKPGNGTKDFAWFVWMKGYNGEPTVQFMNTKQLIAQSMNDQLSLV